MIFGANIDWSFLVWQSWIQRFMEHYSKLLGKIKKTGIDCINSKLKGWSQGGLPVIQITVPKILENTHCGSVPKKSKMITGMVARILGQQKKVALGGDVWNQSINRYRTRVGKKLGDQFPILEEFLGIKVHVFLRFLFSCTSELSISIYPCSPMI